MSASLVTLQAHEPTWEHRSSELIVGKDLLELLSTSMYLDPMTLYREYVQNAADSIDEARQAGILEPQESGRITITVDSAKRNVIIRDNGIGVTKEDFERRLCAFGASSKRGTSARGFRGVGRLAAIGSCQELIFRSVFAGENTAMEMSWNCKNIKTALRSSNPLTLAQVVNSSVKIRPIFRHSIGGHGFEVEMRGIVRHRNDSLLNPAAIYDYLSQVAPAPFAPEFTYATVIKEALAPVLDGPELVIQISGCSEQVYRPHRDQLLLPSGGHVKFIDLEIFQAPAADDGAAAIGWVLHHDYKGAIPTPLLRGLRARAGNIQIGGTDLFQEYFPESRFNSWTVGEIHTLDNRLVPNGRRDHFEQNAHFDNLANHVSVLARSIGARCRFSSSVRNLIRKFELNKGRLEQKIEILQQGAIAEDFRDPMHAAVAVELDALGKLASKEILTPELRSDFQAATLKLRTKAARLLKQPKTHRKLQRISPVKRHVYERAVGVIYKNCPEHSLAQTLVDAILRDIRD